MPDSEAEEPLLPASRSLRSLHQEATADNVVNESDECQRSEHRGHEDEDEEQAEWPAVDEPHDGCGSKAGQGQLDQRGDHPGPSLADHDLVGGNHSDGAVQRDPAPPGDGANPGLGRSVHH